MTGIADATRLAEIGARCERATEGPWVVGGRLECSSILPPGGRLTIGAGFGDCGIQCYDDADFIAHAREDVPWLLVFASRLMDKLLGRHKQADAAWQATESRLVRICQLLGVDYTCEEPETCEQVIERMRADIRELKGKLDIIVREGTDEPPDSLAADYGGTDWEKSKEVVAVRMERGKAAKAEEELVHVRRELVESRGEEEAGWLAVMREALSAQWKREPLVDKWQTMGPFGKEGEYCKCTACGADNKKPVILPNGAKFRSQFNSVKHRETCPWLLCQEALTTAEAPEKGGGE